MPNQNLTQVTCETCRLTLDPDTSDVNIALIRNHQNSLNHHGRRWKISNPSDPEHPPQPTELQQ